MATRKVELKFQLGDRVYSEFYAQTGFIIQVKYEETIHEQSTYYLVRFSPNNERACQEHELELMK